ncbi:MAG TPA: peptidase S9, partial [Verrucomicrobiae bacterium]|nr:peptidase S9 [Verrucomicrobiae bacterium]
MRSLRRLLLVPLVLVLAVFPAHAARLDTSFRFSTLETAHFSLHFHQGLDDVAAKAAVIAEEVHSPLVRLFGWEPVEKTQVIVADASDFANGWATVLPRNTIFIQPVPPEPDSTLTEYDDWLRTILAHEYTHILTNDVNRGYSRITRSIFGKTLPAGDLLSTALFLSTTPPNIFMPTWWHEGNAVWAETELTSGGRGRSAWFQMVYRAAVDEENIPKVSEINGDVPWWPRGNLPYMFGVRLFSHIREKYGEEALRQLNSAHSGRFPYAIGTPPEQVSGGLDYAAIYREMTEELRREQSARIAQLKTLPVT